AAANYTLMLQAINTSGIYSNASYRIRIHAIGPLPVNFDGGNSPIAGQLPGTWQYFTVTVPTNALGWDLRLTNVTSGDPRLVVRRALAPDSFYSHDANGGGWPAYYNTTWPTGNQWSASSAYDWSRVYYDATGSHSPGHSLQ